MDSIRMTGFDLEVICPACETAQSVQDEITTLGSDELVELLAVKGAYRLNYSLLCWHCGVWMRGGFVVRSRRLSEAPPMAEGDDCAMVDLAAARSEMLAARRRKP